MTADRRRPIALGIALVALGVLAWWLVRGRTGSIGADAERATGSASAVPPAPIAESELAASGTTARLPNDAESVAEAPAEGDAPAPAPAPPTRVEFVDAETGAAVRGCEFLDAKADVGPSWSVEVRGPRIARASAPPLGSLGPPVLKPGETITWPASIARRSVALPTGFVVVAHPAEDTVLVRHATSFRVVQPVHREVDVRVTFTDDSGQPSRGGKVVAWRVGDFVQRPAVVETIAGGRVRVRGVPFVSGATLRLQCERDTGKDPESPPDMPLEVEAEPEPVDAKFDSPFRWPMPASYRETIDARVPIAALAEPTIVDQEIEWDLGESIVETKGPPTFGTLRVEVRGLDGRPLMSVPVAVLGSSGTTDRAGVATLIGVPSGSRDINLHDPGRLFESASATVAAETETRLTVNEIEGGTLDLEVVDAAGSPAPSRASRSTPSRGRRGSTSTTGASSGSIRSPTRAVVARVGASRRGR
jgi:hypothetical protein